MQNKPKEIKIIAQLDPLGVILSHNVMVYIDDEPVGCIQDITFKASVEKLACDLDITFPDFHSEEIDKAYNIQPNLTSTADYYIEKFKSLLGVKVHLIDIFKKS